MFAITSVFKANRLSSADIVINQGGTSSSKTYSIIQLLFYIAMEQAGSIITVVGQDIPNLKKGAYRDAENIYAGTPALDMYVLSWNKGERIIYFKNGSLIEFNSYDNEQDARNGKRDYLFINEANGIDYNVFFQLCQRTRKKTFIDYNPSAPFWCHDMLIGTSPKSNDFKAAVQLLISDHRHNRFLTLAQHDKIESIRDPDLWRVYARGLTGNVKGLIYPDWHKIPDEDFPKQGEKFGGLDFGYTNDPTAGVKCIKIGESIFVHELCYTPGLSAIHTKQLFGAEGFTDSDPIYCEHDEDAVLELRRLDLYCLPARKGPGSIKAGIKKVKEYKIFYTASSKNIDEERKRYMWMIDPLTGKALNKPIDKWNHLMDAVRYAIYTHFYT